MGTSPPEVVQQPVLEDAGLHLAAFFDANLAGAALRASSFDLPQLLETQIALVRDPDPKVSQKAITQFWRMVKDISNANGVTGKVRQEQIFGFEDGTRGRVTETRNVTLTGRLSNTRPQPTTPGVHHHIQPQVQEATQRGEGAPSFLAESLSTGHGDPSEGGDLPDGAGDGGCPDRPGPPGTGLDEDP